MLCASDSQVPTSDNLIKETPAGQVSSKLSSPPGIRYATERLITLATDFEMPSPSKKSPARSLDLPEALSENPAFSNLVGEVAALSTRPCSISELFDASEWAQALTRLPAPVQTHVADAVLKNLGSRPFTQIVSAATTIVDSSINGLCMLASSCSPGLLAPTDVRFACSILLRRECPAWCCAGVLCNSCNASTAAYYMPIDLSFLSWADQFRRRHVAFGVHSVLRYLRHEHVWWDNMIAARKRHAPCHPLICYACAPLALNAQGETASGEGEDAAASSGDAADGALDHAAANRSLGSTLIQVSAAEVSAAEGRVAEGRCGSVNDDDVRPLPPPLPVPQLPAASPSSAPEDVDFSSSDLLPLVPLPSRDPNDPLAADQTPSFAQCSRDKYHHIAIIATALLQALLRTYIPEDRTEMDDAPEFFALDLLWEAGADPLAALHAAATTWVKEDAYHRPPAPLVKILRACSQRLAEMGVEVLPCETFFAAAACDVEWMRDLSCREGFSASASFAHVVPLDAAVGVYEYSGTSYPLRESMIELLFTLGADVNVQVRRRIADTLRNGRAKPSAWSFLGGHETDDPRNVEGVAFQTMSLVGAAMLTGSMGCAAQLVGYGAELDCSFEILNIGIVAACRRLRFEDLNPYLLDLAKFFDFEQRPTMALDAALRAGRYTVARQLTNLGAVPWDWNVVKETVEGDGAGWWRLALWSYGGGEGLRKWVKMCGARSLMAGFTYDAPCDPLVETDDEDFESAALGNGDGEEGGQYDTDGLTDIDDFTLVNLAAQGAVGAHGGGHGTTQAYSAWRFQQPTEPLETVDDVTLTSDHLAFLVNLASTMECEEVRGAVALWVCLIGSLDQLRRLDASAPRVGDDVRDDGGSNGAARAPLMGEEEDGTAALASTFRRHHLLARLCMCIVAGRPSFVRYLIHEAGVDFTADLLAPSFTSSQPHEMLTTILSDAEPHVWMWPMPRLAHQSALSEAFHFSREKVARVLLQVWPPITPQMGLSDILHVALSKRVPPARVKQLIDKGAPVGTLHDGKNVWGMLLEESGPPIGAIDCEKRELVDVLRAGGAGAIPVLWERTKDFVCARWLLEGGSEISVKQAAELLVVFATLTDAERQDPEVVDFVRALTARFGVEFLQMDAPTVSQSKPFINADGSTSHVVFKTLFDVVHVFCPLGVCMKCFAIVQPFCTLPASVRPLLSSTGRAGGGGSDGKKKAAARGGPVAAGGSGGDAVDTLRSSTQRRPRGKRRGVADPTLNVNRRCWCSVVGVARGD